MTEKKDTTFTITDRRKCPSKASHVPKARRKTRAGNPSLLS